MPERRAILHIGTEKTGTSSLQVFLSKNRDRLNARGFHFARFAGPVSHEHLAAYAMDDDKRDDMRLGIGVHSDADLHAFRARLEAEAEAEIEAHEGRLFLFSGEHCSSRLVTHVEVERLWCLLAPHFDRVDVAVYLRRQDELAVSLYSTAMKSGNPWLPILPRPEVVAEKFDYSRVLDRYAAVFGADRVHPRLFDRSELAGGSVIQDFLEVWDLGSGYEMVPRVNESLEPEAQEFLRRINGFVPPVVDGRSNPIRGDLPTPISRAYAGKGRRPARADAEAFQAFFAESNEAVRARWFPERESLFSTDFSGYPETEDTNALTADQAVEMAAELWRHLRERELRALCDLAIRDGQIAEMLGDRAAAVGHYARAVGLDPDRPMPATRLKELEAEGAAADDREDSKVRAEWLRTGGTGGLIVTDQSEAPWAGALAAEARTHKLRKRFSLNGLRRLVGLPPVQPGP